jgi:CarboxypepD_reg-like domain
MGALRVFFISLFLVVKVYSQTSVLGKVVDRSSNTIQYISVVIKAGNNSIVNYTYTNIEGEFEFEISKTGKFNVIFSALGYESKSVTIEIAKEKQEVYLNIILNPKTFELNEVIIHASKPITVKKDTIVFNVKSFLKGNEQVVEDLLKNIPGININNEGTIKIGNQEVEKVMIDGDDFFEKGYKILTKNMPVNPIEKVEILQRYSNNKLLKSIENSDKVALNFKLKEDAKRQWFGNINIGYDMASKNQYDGQSNLMNFGNKNKYYFLTNFNNIGYNATGDINHLVRPYNYGEPAGIGDNESANTLLGLSVYIPNFKASRTNFNNAELLSLNAIFTPSKKIKIKTLGFFNWDENDFFRNSTQIFSVNETNFTNTEDYTLRKKKFIGFGKIDLTYDISKTKMLEITSKYNNQNENSGNTLVFNTAQTNESLKSENELFDQKITFTNKFKDKKVFLLTGRFVEEKTPQNYSVNQFFYQDLFPTYVNANSVEQQSENQMQFSGFEAHLLDRKENGDLLELQFGNTFRKDKLNTTFILFENSTVLENPNGFQNITEYQTNDLYLKTKYRYKIKDFAITGKLGLYQLFNQLKFDDFSEKQQPFFVNPSIGFDWKINNKNKIYTSLSNTTTNAKIVDVYNNYVLTGFRSFSKGTGTFNQLDASTLLLNYQLGNWSDRFFANTIILYSKNHDFFSTNTFITQNYSQSEKIVIKDREFLSISSKLDYYFKVISSNLKLDVGYSKSNYKNIVNNSNLREVKFNNYNYGFELRSGFKGVFNYHFGTKWTESEVITSFKNSFTDNISFLDISLVLSNKFDLQLQTERYFFGNLDKENNTYYFADLNTRYTLKKNKLIFSISGKNLFNTQTFRNYAITDISVSTTEYKLLPRYVLLKMEYRF